MDTTKQNFKKPLGYARNEIPRNNPELPKQFNNSWMNKTVNTFNNMHKQITNTLSVRSHRTLKKNKYCNETIANGTISKLDTTVDKKQTHTEKPVENNVGKVNSKADVQSKSSTDKPKPKLNTQNDKKNNALKSTTQSTKTKEKSSIKEKRAASPKNDTKKSESKSKPQKTSKTSQKTNNTETQKNNTKTKNKTEKPNESIQVTQSQQNKKEKSPKRKTKPDNQNTKKKNLVVQPANSNLNKTVQNTSFSGRPLRSCRTSSHSRSELSGSQLNSSFDINKSLRSRVINLSSSIENITIKITSKKKNNKANISQINPRNSDVSFSLRSKDQTPVAKRTSGRSRADFCKGKR